MLSPLGVLTGILDLCKHGPTPVFPGPARPGHGHSPELGVRNRKLPFPWLTRPTSQGSCEAPGRENRRGLGNWTVRYLGVANALMPQEPCLLQSSSSACSPACPLAAHPFSLLPTGRPSFLCPSRQEVLPKWPPNPIPLTRICRV